ncbi:ribbon-helix-helix domain-containing protein [Devosia sp.]|uniref:ribbon-helix-helix domain-containing protein n=1 Tax=Devosia sp. TaxID=1871048 RepID=UPI00326601B9
MEKRSLSIAGHRTSIALEPEFWAVLQAMADERELALPALIKSIDEARLTTNLASAARLAALSWVQAKPR